MADGNKLLLANLKKLCSEDYKMVDMFHGHCIAHVVNLAVREARSVIYSYVSKIHSILNSLRLLINQRKIFSKVKVKMGCEVELSSMKWDTGWSSTLKTIRSTLKASSVINDMTDRI